MFDYFLQMRVPKSIRKLAFKIFSRGSLSFIALSKWVAVQKKLKTINLMSSIMQDQIKTQDLSVGKRIIFFKGELDIKTIALTVNFVGRVPSK